MNVTVAEFAVVSGALALFVLVPAALALITARRRAADARRQAHSLARVELPADDAPYPSDTPIEIGTSPDATSAEPAPPVGLRPPRPWTQAHGPERTFQLFALRDAARDVAPADAPFLDRSSEAQAEIKARRSELERMSLRGPIDAAAFAFVGIERAGNDAQFVALLFSELWPESENDAVARAVFRLSEDGAIVSTAVEPT